MKSDTVGYPIKPSFIGAPPGSPVDKCHWPAPTHGWAQVRYNGTKTVDSLPLELHAHHRWAAVDASVGTYEWVPALRPDGKPGYCRAKFTAGPRAIAWMEAQDRAYLNEIKVSNPALFLKEMTPRGELLPADQAAQLGLDLSLSHHRALQAEFALDVERIRHERGLGAAGGGGGAGAAIPIAAPLPTAVPTSVDSAELARLRAEVVRLQHEVDRQQRAFVEEAARTAALRHQLADTTFEATHLAEALERAEGQLVHLRLRADVAISSREAKEGLMRIWQGKHTPEGSVPTFTPVAPKEAGVSVGFIAAKAHTKRDARGEAKRWMAKFGLPDLTAEVTESMTSRGRDHQRTVITSIKEKIAADAYALIGHGAFYVPKHRLASLPVLNEYTRGHIVALAMMEQLNRGRTEATMLTHGVHLMSKWLSGYQDLDQLRDCVGRDGVAQGFMDCLTAGYVPETVRFEGRMVPLLGLMEMLAVSRLLADTDVLGGGGKNAGFVIERDVDRNPIAVRIVKIDAGESFNFDGANNQFIQSFNRASRAQKLTDQKDIQFGNMQPIVVLWESLSKQQKNAFIQTLHKGSAYLTHPANLELLIRREGEFDKAGMGGRPLLTPPMIEAFKAHWLGYIALQGEAEVYGTLLRDIPPPQTAVAFVPKHFGATHLKPFDATPLAAGAGAH